MGGQVKDMAIRDYKKFSQAGFSTEINFLDEDPVIVVDGLTSKHNMSYTQEGTPVSSLNAHITVSEKVLNEAGITTRDGNKKFILKGKKVSFKDASEQLYTYMIDEVFPSETLGIIVCTLGTWK
jgi:hypothetical protein